MLDWVVLRTRRIEIQFLTPSAQNNLAVNHRRVYERFPIDEDRHTLNLVFVDDGLQI